MALFAAGVLAGVYRGADISARTLLSHAVSDGPVTIGRISRVEGQALCDRKLETETSLVDSGAWEDVSKVDCPRCRKILDRMK